MPSHARWTADIFYLPTTGFAADRHRLEELEELQHIVERGPDWNCIERIVVTFVAASSADRKRAVESAVAQSRLKR